MYQIYLSVCWEAALITTLYNLHGSSKDNEKTSEKLIEVFKLQQVKEMKLKDNRTLNTLRDCFHPELIKPLYDLMVLRF